MLKRLAVVAAVVLVVSGCSSGGGSGIASLEDDSGQATEGSSAVEEVDPEQAALDFTECMREHGVDMDDPTVDENGNLRLQMRVDPGEGTFDREAMRAAQDACAAYLEGVTMPFQERDMTAMQDMLVEYAECMRENGYDMPDPDLSGFGGPGLVEGEPGEGEVVRGPFGGMDFGDPAFQAANEVCQSIFSEFMGEEGSPGGPGFGGGPEPSGGGE